jgi:hypothetical protein
MDDHKEDCKADGMDAKHVYPSRCPLSRSCFNAVLVIELRTTGVSTGNLRRSTLFRPYAVIPGAQVRTKFPDDQVVPECEKDKPAQNW